MRYRLPHVLFLVLLILAARWTPVWALVVFAGIPLGAYLYFANQTHPFRMVNASVVITGASSGLGEAIAVEAALRGARRVHLLARSKDGLARTAKRIHRANPRCETYVHPCDLADPEAVTAVAQKILTRYGPPELLVNNAGAGTWKHIEETEPADVYRDTAVPYLGAAHLTALLLPEMALQRHRGLQAHILNITSIASISGIRGAVTYGTARWAMRGFTHNLRADTAELDVGVTLVNAAEITGTAYFDADRAGNTSHERFPWLFRLPIIRLLSYDAPRAARASLDAVQEGTFEAYLPWYLLSPLMTVHGLFPDAITGIAGLGHSARVLPTRTSPPEEA